MTRRDGGAVTVHAAAIAFLLVVAALVIVQGWLADTYGLQNSFLLTAACELYVLFYAVWGSRTTNALPEQTAR